MGCFFEMMEAYKLGRRVSPLRLAGSGYGVIDMQLEKQVCSLDLAKRLKELGVKQESLFYRVKSNIAEGWFYHMWNSPMNDVEEKVSAFTVAELGEMLPMEIWSEHRDTDYLWCWKSLKHYSCGYGILDDNNIDYMTICDAETEADARAKMLIYLVENKLITV